MVICVGKYSNSYKAHLGELAEDGYVYRFADSEIDDTCFTEGARTFYSVDEAREALADVRAFADALAKAIQDATKTEGKQ